MIDISELGDTPLERLKTLMARLRDPEDGCPWDVDQTFATIAPHTIEEAYEVSDAIDRDNMVDLKEELGDLMFQVIFHSRMAEEQGAFTMDEVCDALTTKMVRRHPHIFADGDTRTSEEQVVAWEDQKAAERKLKGKETPSGHISILDDVALSLPALMRSEKLQKRAARVGFDWPNLDGVMEKIIEEAREFIEAAHTQNKDEMEDEMGDLLFAVTNLARKSGIDPERALRRTNRKFITRFQYIEDRVRQDGANMEDKSLDELEALWQAAKRT